MALHWRIILGIVVVLIGFFMIYKTMAVQGWTGIIPWAEKKIGPGGTPSFIKLLGLLVIFIGIFIATGVINDVMRVVVGIFPTPP